MTVNGYIPCTYINTGLFSPFASNSRNQKRCRIVRFHVEGIATAERARNIHTSPHVMYLIISGQTSTQSRDVGKCKSLGRSGLASVDNKHVHAFRRVTSVVLGRGSCWGIGCSVERSSWTANSAILMERKQLGVLDNGKLNGGKFAQLEQLARIFCSMLLKLYSRQFPTGLGSS